MEMMACGGAVVVGRVTGYDEYIIDEYNALVVDATDVLAATMALKRLMADKSLYTKLIENGKKTAQNWSWNKSIQDLEQYYQRSLVDLSNDTRCQQEYITDINKSISHLYFMIKGEAEDIGNDKNNNYIKDLMLNEHTERVCRKLKTNSLFRFLSRLIVKIHSLIKH